MDKNKMAYNRKDREIFNVWSEEFESNIRYLLKMAEGKSELNGLANYKEYDKVAAWNKVEKQIKRKSGISPLIYRTAAAVIILLASVFLIRQLYFETPGSTKEILALEKQIIDLPDGSQVYMDADSKLSYDKKEFANNRVVQFEGRANFDIQPNPSKEFQVLSDELIIRVLGTQFEVNTQSENDEVIVTEGIVAIDSRSEKKQIKAGQKAMIVDNAIRIKDVEHIFLNKWVEEALSFDNVPIKDVMTELSDHFNVNIDLSAQNNNSGCLIKTEFYNETLLEILEEFKTIFGADTKIKGDTIYINDLQCD